MVEALVIGNLRVVKLHWTVVVIAEIVTVNCSIVCVNRALRGWLLLVGRILRNFGLQVLAGLSGKEWMGHGTLPLLLGFS